MNLDRNQFLLVVDATNGLALTPELGYKTQIYADTVDSIALDHSDKKWNVDQNELKEIMSNGSEEEYKQLWEEIQNYWDRHNRE